MFELKPASRSPSKVDQQRTTSGDHQGQCDDLGRVPPEENKAVPAGRTIDRRYEIDVGDILLSRANTEQYVGAVVFVRETRPKLLLSDKSLRLVPVGSIDHQWLSEVLASPEVRRQISNNATGMKDSMRNISQANLRDIRIPAASWSQQQEAITRLRAVRDSISRLDLELRNTQSRSEQLRRSLLAEAFAGRLVAQQPDDEPASVLLQRIRTEQAARPKRGADARRR